MSGLHNLKPERVVKAFERAGWTNEGQRGSHVKLTKEGTLLSCQSLSIKGSLSRKD